MLFGVFLDTRFRESVVIQMTGILYKIVYFGFGFITIFDTFDEFTWKYKCL